MRASVAGQRAAEVEGKDKIIRTNEVKCLFSNWARREVRRRLTQEANKAATLTLFCPRPLPSVAVAPKDCLFASFPSSAEEDDAVVELKGREEKV